MRSKSLKYSELFQLISTNLCEFITTKLWKLLFVSFRSSIRVTALMLAPSISFMTASVLITRDKLILKKFIQFTILNWYFLKKTSILFRLTEQERGCTLPSNCYKNKLNLTVQTWKMFWEKYLFGWFNCWNFVWEQIYHSNLPEIMLNSRKLFALLGLVESLLHYLVACNSV